MNTIQITATPDEVANLISNLIRWGAEVVRNNRVTPLTYSISDPRMSATAIYEGSTLSVNVIKKPWYITMDAIRTRLEEAIGEKS